MLEFYYCFIIIGLFGLGKIIIVFQLVCWKCGRLKLYFCQNFEEILDKVDGKYDMYIVMDDWIDYYVYYLFILLEVVKCLDKIYGDFVKNGNVYFILIV